MAHCREISCVGNNTAIVAHTDSRCIIRLCLEYDWLSINIQQASRTVISSFGMCEGEREREQGTTIDLNNYASVYCRKFYGFKSDVMISD